jgi:signal transduction histidine kinase
MSTNVLTQAFDPFFTAKPFGERTSFDLSMVYRFAKQSEGHVRIYSEAGKGTTAKIYLPHYNGELQGEIAASGLSEAHRSKRARRL